MCGASVLVWYASTTATHNMFSDMERNNELSSVKFLKKITYPKLALNCYSFYGHKQHFLVYSCPTSLPLLIISDNFLQ